ncbi:hypothetical protein V8J82_22695 [Gymnodinialimonas sp. 2305UL16-5]
MDSQNDRIGIDASWIVVPLREEDRYVAVPGLAPLITVEGISRIIRVQELADPR